MQDRTNLNRAGSVGEMLVNRAESVDAMMTSAAPEGIKRLAEFAEDMNVFGFPVAELDEIADGKNTERHRESAGDGVYLYSLLPSIDWWVGISSCLSFGRSAKGIYGDPAFKEQRERLFPLLNDVLTSYTPALAASQRFSDSDGDALNIELLKRYAIFRRAVCDFARDVWPDVNLDWIYQQP
jgi:hypothetical protein